MLLKLFLLLPTFHNEAYDLDHYTYWKLYYVLLLSFLQFHFALFLFYLTIYQTYFLVFLVQTPLHLICALYKYPCQKIHSLNRGKKYGMLDKRNVIRFIIHKRIRNKETFYYSFITYVKTTYLLFVLQFDPRNQKRSKESDTINVCRCFVSSF